MAIVKCGSAWNSGLVQCIDAPANLLNTKPRIGMQRAYITKLSPYPSMIAALDGDIGRLQQVHASFQNRQHAK